MPSFDLLRVLEAKPVGPGVLWLRFSDRSQGTVDLRDQLPPAFPELAGEAYFARVRVTRTGLEWPNGFDCDAEWLASRVASSGSDPRESGDEWATLRAHARRMPEISRFFGMVIHMLYNDHAPPHFHAAYGEFEISIEIDGDGVKGSMPRNGLAMLLEWRDQHREELLVNWRRMREGESPLPILPLE